MGRGSNSIRWYCGVRDWYSGFHKSETPGRGGWGVGGVREGRGDFSIFALSSAHLAPSSLFARASGSSCAPPRCQTGRIWCASTSATYPAGAPTRARPGSAPSPCAGLRWPRRRRCRCQQSPRSAATSSRGEALAQHDSYVCAKRRGRSSMRAPPTACLCRRLSPRRVSFLARSHGARAAGGRRRVRARLFAARALVLRVASDEESLFESGGPLLAEAPARPSRHRLRATACAPHTLETQH